MEQVLIRPNWLLLFMIVAFFVVATIASRRRKQLGRSRYDVIVCGHCGASQPTHAAFCRQAVGRFVHHVPTSEDEEPAGGAAAARERTLAAIRAAGYTVDPELWGEAADCNQCHAGPSVGR